MDINKYVLNKLVNSMIFDFSNKNYDDMPNLFNLVIINKLYDLVKFYTEYNYLTKTVIRNIQDYLMAARLYKDENTKKRNEIINDIITLLNKQTIDNSLIFYRIELYQRTNDYRYLTKATDEQIKSEIDLVHKSICNDLAVVDGHSPSVSDEDFNDCYLDIYIEEAALYYESILKILKENPRIFMYKTFYDRMRLVINKHLEVYSIDKDLKSISKKLIKMVDKTKKKYDKKKTSNC